MKFPEEYIIHGDFVLHSGERSKILYDVNALMTNEIYLKYTLRKIPANEHYVGIATGGALLAMASHVQYPYSKFSMIKDGKLLGEKPSEAWYLIDDVVTTGKSLLEAISIVGSNPGEIIVVIDRRKENINPEVRAIFQP